MHLGISLTGDQVVQLEEHGTLSLSGALLTARENPGKELLLQLVVLITAAGLQGVQPLVDRTM